MKTVSPLLSIMEGAGLNAFPKGWCFSLSPEGFATSSKVGTHLLCAVLDMIFHGRCQHCCSANLELVLYVGSLLSVTVCYVLGENRYDRINSYETHELLAPPHPTMPPISGWTSWQDPTLLGQHLCKEGEMALLLVGTGGMVYKGAFLTLLPWGTRHQDVGSAHWSGSVLFPAPATCSADLIQSHLSKHILTETHPCPQTSCDSSLSWGPSRAHTPAFPLCCLWDHLPHLLPPFNLCAVPLSINQISLPDPKCFLPGIFPPHFLLPNQT